MGAEIQHQKLGVADGANAPGGVLIGMRMLRVGDKVRMMEGPSRPDAPSDSRTLDSVIRTSRNPSLRL